METMIKDDDFELYRFQCTCMSPDDPLDVYIENKKMITFSMYASRGCGHGFWVRLKRAVRYLFNLEPEPWYDMVLRPEDVPELIKVLESVKNESR